MAIFVSAMIGGGIIYIDDKARGLHEGYLVTPISKFELIMGFNLSGAAKAVLAGIVLTTVGSVIAGIPNPLEPIRMLKLLLVIVLTSLALISMMFFLMVRVNDPLVPRATFGVLNTLLYFPSGAVYPIYGFPPWMRAISRFDPFTYAVHAFKSLLLKNTGIMAIAGDLTFLAVVHSGYGDCGNRPLQALPLTFPLAIAPASNIMWVLGSVLILLASREGPAMTLLDATPPKPASKNRTLYSDCPGHCHRCRGGLHRSS